MTGNPFEGGKPLSYEMGCPCSNDDCKVPLPPLVDCAEEFFTQGSVRCTKCGKDNDLWGALTKIAGHLPGFLTTVLGPRSTAFHFELSAGRSTRINLVEKGIPESATVLSLTVTGQNATCLPIEWHGNQVYPRRPSKTLSFHGLHVKDAGSEPSTIVAYVVWADPPDDQVAWNTLIESLEAFQAGRLRQMIVPAWSAVEQLLSKFVRIALNQNISKTKVDGYFDNNRYSAADGLNILTPILCAANGLPEIPQTIHNELNMLRRTRNDLVHDDHDPQLINESKATQLLIGAVLGFHYYRILVAKLGENKADSGESDR